MSTARDSIRVPLATHGVPPAKPMATRGWLGLMPEFECAGPARRALLFEGLTIGTNMNQKRLLRRFEYSTIARKTTDGIQTRELYVNVDFNESKFYLKGNWNSLVHACNDAKMAFLSMRQGQIEIGMNIFPCGLVNLEDVSNDGLILFLKGALNDGAETNSCAGMLVFSHMLQKKGSLWFLSCYLYEPGSGYSEIKFRFPVCEDGEVIRKIFKYS